MALSENYKRALTALKDQAEAIRDGIQADNGDKDRLAAKSALRDAQRRLTEVAEESKHIVRLILKPDVRGITIPKSKIELWHHRVDGAEGSTLVDWPFMDDYWKKFAAALDLPLYFSWLEGGFEGEMLKQNSYSRPHKVETPEGLLTLERDTTRAQPATWRKYPQVSPSLQTRWCSGELKISVGRRAINNQSRFDGKKILFITGERREESSNRAKYFQLEPHACDRRNGRMARTVDAWRPVLHWDESKVWEIMESTVSPHRCRIDWGGGVALARPVSIAHPQSGRR